MSSAIESKEQEKKEKRQMCGLVMPISMIDGLGIEHWREVKSILVDVASSLNLKARVVSTADESGIIQQRIVQNLFEDDIVIVDVSAKNPNVMFELGLRLAFDKPTIVIKDNATDYSFDTSPIEHLEYPRDLRFAHIVEFKENLANKISATLVKAKDKNYSTFLKHFGTFKPKGLEEKEGGISDYLISSLDEIRTEISKLKRPNVITESVKKRVAFDLDDYLNQILDEHSKKLKLQRFDVLGDTAELIKLSNIAHEDLLTKGYSITKEKILQELKEQLPF